MSQQRLQDKLKSHLNFLNQDPDNLSLLVEIHSVYAELGDLESAQKYLDQANAIDREACLGHQGLMHLNRGELSLAKDCFAQALTHEDTPELRYNLGFCHYMAYDFDQAWSILAPLLEGDHFPDAELLMARILHRQEALDEATGLIENILEHNPYDPEALGLLSLFYLDLDEHELALETAERALELNPETYDAKLVSIMTRLLKKETSVEEIEALLQINPQDGRLWFALGNTYMTLGEMNTAAFTFEKALAIYPDFYDCYIALAWCHLLQDDLAKAEATYQKAATLVPELADAWGGLAIVQTLQEDFLQAEQWIDKANALTPNNFLTEVAESIYYNHKNPAKAKQHLFNALKNVNTAISEKLALVIKEMEMEQEETVH